MTEHHDTDKRPHGETGDTVQQAAEVSKPTTSAGRVLDSDKVPQAPLNPAIAGDTGGNAGGANSAGIAADATPGRDKAP